MRIAGELIMSKNQVQTKRGAAFRPRMVALAVLAAMPLLQASVTHAAPFDISNVPLYLGGTLDPNLMYIHDDSGSMYWSFLPDNASSNSIRATSNASNLQYYDPTATYLAPVDHNGDSLGDASFTSAWFNGYDLANRGSYRVNLSTSFRATWGYSGSWIGSSQAAYYHQFSPPRPGCAAPGNITDTDCYVKVVVPVAQRQNFANWYSYYRTRVYAAKAGISRAFATLGEGIRVGYGRINDGTSNTHDGKSVPVIQRGVRAFSGTAREQFFDWLFAAPADGGTPLRRSLDAAGKYFDNDNAVGPWSTTPGVSGGEHLSCRKSFTILMTDGYWNGSASGPALSNNDGTSGPSQSGPNGASFTYSAVSPFTDTYSNTLSDVAMYYWKNDLSSLDNRVPKTTLDPAFWQHMTTYTIGFGLSGTIDPDAAFDAITTGASISWINPVGTPDGHPAKIDDLLHAAVNSRGGYFSAKNPTEFSDALAKTLAAINSAVSTASAAVANSTRLDGNTMVYQAKYNSGDWTGEFLGFKLNPTTGALITPEAWDAADKIPAHGARNIFTWRTDTGSGADFEWADLSAAQKAELGNSSALLDYLRGDKTNEGTGATEYRIRNSKLGDVVNSTAAFVGTQDFGYGNATGLSAAEQSSYKTRRASGGYKGRAQTLYFGANDGMLHAIDATSGDERFAYVPNALFAGGNLAALADKDYTHRYYVDGSPKTADAPIRGNWRTVLVGSTGAGGRAYFAMDVEDATAFDKSKVLWEFTDPDLGVALGQASIVRTESGDWVALFGNGYNSDNHTARLFVLNLETGAVLAELDTAVGTAANPNGLSTPMAVDSDLNGNADLVYAGDMYGNLWKFDLSGGTSGSWKIAYGGKPLFEAKDSANKAQPITAKPQAGRFAARGKPEIMVYFGTGKFFEVGDQGAVSDPQTIYGVVDECGTSSGGSCASPTPLQRGSLLEQSIYHEVVDASFTDGSNTYEHDIRLITDDPLAPSDKGFFIDLVSPLNGLEGERLVNQPVLSEDRVQFITMTPDPDPCSAGGWSWFLELDPVTGGQTKFSPFDLNKDDEFTDQEFYNGPNGAVPVNGRRHAGGIVTGPPAKVGGPEGCVEVLPGDGNPMVQGNACPGSGRRSWRQIR
jgi:type IV pilus assembly protein PilY1